MQTPCVLTIAGSDPSGGAGVQADLKTLADMGVQGLSVITALTAQTREGVRAVYPVAPEVVRDQLQTLLQAHPPIVIKLGLIGSANTLAVIRETLEAIGYEGWLIADPVRAGSDGHALVEPAVREVWRNWLPAFDLITPNLPEARWLTGCEDPAPEAQREALLALGPQSVLLKGGHAPGDGDTVVDRWADGPRSFALTSPRRPGGFRGTGCILSAAIAGALGRGYALNEALVLGKRYLNQALRLASPDEPAWCGHGGWPGAVEDVPGICVHGAPLPEGFFPDTGGELGVYPVVDSVEWVERVLAAGAPTVQLRIKNEDTARLRRAVGRAVALGREYGGRVFINDHWQLALEVGAYGVHLGQEDLDTADLPALARAGLRLGISTHSEWEIARALTCRPSYIAFGPIFPTTTKTMAFAPQGLTRLREWVALVSPVCPTVAIGGINADNAAAVAATGVGGLAMVRAVTEAADPSGAIDGFRQCLESASSVSP